MLKPAEMARLAVQAMEDKKAQDITLMRTTDVTVLADYFVICTAASTTQVKSISDAVEYVLTEAGEAEFEQRITERIQIEYRRFLRAQRNPA